MTNGIAECLWGPNVCQPLYSHRVMVLYIFFCFGTKQLSGGKVYMHEVLFAAD